MTSRYRCEHGRFHLRPNLPTTGRRPPPPTIELNAVRRDIVNAQTHGPLAEAIICSNRKTRPSLTKYCSTSYLRPAETSPSALFVFLFFFICRCYSVDDAKRTSFESRVSALLSTTDKPRRNPVTDLAGD